jgi:hypothetical protein
LANDEDFGKGSDEVIEGFSPPGLNLLPLASIKLSFFSFWEEEEEEEVCLNLLPLASIKLSFFSFSVLKFISPSVLLLEGSDPFLAGAPGTTFGAACGLQVTLLAATLMCLSAFIAVLVVGRSNVLVSCAAAVGMSPAKALLECFGIAEVALVLASLLATAVETFARRSCKSVLSRQARI